MACILEELENTLKKQLGNTKNSKEFKDGATKAKERVAELSTLLNEVVAMKKAMQGQFTNNVDMYSNLPNRKGDTFTNHTGGAYGADSIWADMLRLYGVDNKHYRPVKDMPTKRLKDLSAKKDEVVSITKEEQDAGKALNTKLGNSVHDLNNRNFVQILNADAVFAVAPIKDGKVQGGTGSATRMASELGKQVYVLDTETVQWMKEVGGNYVVMDELPKFPINFAAVGTRGIESYPKKNRDGSWGTTELHNNTKEILALMQKTVDNSFNTQTKNPINISSNSKGLAGALTNPTELSKRKGNISKDYPITHNGVEYISVEEAFQKNKVDETVTKPSKDKSSNYKLMVKLITNKLLAYPELVKGIDKEGGMDYLNKVVHQPTNKNSVWETGGQNWFMNALKEAYVDTKNKTELDNHGKEAEKPLEDGNTVKVYSQFDIQGGELDGKHITYHFNPENYANRKGPDELVPEGTKVNAYLTGKYVDNRMTYYTAELEIDGKRITTQQDGKRPLHITVALGEGVKPFETGMHAEQHPELVEKIPEKKIEVEASVFKGKYNSKYDKTRPAEVEPKESAKQEADIIVPTDAFKSNVNRKIECKE